MGVEVKADYYSDISPYIKFIVENIKQNETKIIDEYTKEAFNTIFSLLTKETIEECAREIIETTALFEKKIVSIRDLEEKENRLKYYYYVYILPMILCYSKKDYRYMIKIYHNLDIKIKEDVGYYSTYKKNNERIKEKQYKKKKGDRYV